jgi:hypothetical protein
MDSYQAPRKLVVTPPVIREAEDGGLGYDDIIENPWRHVTAQMGDWGRLIPGDVIEVLWGPSLESVARHVYRDDDDRAVILKIDVARIHGIGEGVMPLASRITTIETGESQQSEATTVVVKFSIPGGLDPDARTPYLNENLAPPVVGPLPLPDDFTGISVTIPPYLNMAAGDSLSVRWQGVAVTRPGLAADEVGRPVRIAIDRETAMMAAGQDATVVYQVYDVVANWSRWSPSAVVSVPPDETSSPVAPWVIGTVDDEGRQLRVASLTGKEANVRVENHPALVGDLIAVVWDGVTAAGKAVSYVCPEQEVRRPGQSMDFFIPYPHVAELAAGEAIVSYRLLSGGKTIRSRRRRLSILGEAPALAPPTVREARDGVLDPSLATDGVHVIVPAWAGLRPEDRCYLEWTGQKQDGQPTFFNANRSGGDVEADGTLVFVVPHEEAVRITGGKLRIRYHVAVYSAVRSEHGLRTEPVVQLASPWLELMVSRAVAPLSIDSTPVTLSGPLIRLEKRVTTPPQGTSITRVATGGVPPYRYSARGGAVEVDATTGRVVSLRNGDATVTVTDAKSASASYPLKVSNVLHLVDLEKELLWSAAAAEASKDGGRLPHVEEWDALRAAYGGAPGVRDNPAWTDTAASKSSRYVVAPNTGAREARRSSFGRNAPDERWIPISPTLGSGWVWIITAPQA